MIAVANILKLTRQLFPTGRAWKIAVNSVFEKMMKGLAESEVRAYNFAKDSLFLILPDNENLTSEDAAIWERRLNIKIQPDSLNIDKRRELILRKYQHPGSFLNRQNYRYIEYQLQLAGFDVTITENLDETLLIGEYLQHADDTEHGLDSEMGSINVDIIANSAFQGELFDVANSLDVFIITGDVSPTLITTFRKLVLTLKPANTVALLDLTYINTGDLSLVNGDNLYLVNGSNLVLTTYV